MITKTDLDSIIYELDESINKYALKFNTNKKMFDYQTDNHAFFTNERTVAGFSTIMLSYLLKNKGYTPILTVNEFPIELKNKLTVSEFDSLRSTTSLKTRTTQWDKCYVDGYIQVKNVFGSNETTQLFIEYKMENKLVLLNLASDYLKYKSYTYKSTENTAFVYIVLKKEENYPSIINTSTPYFELIQYDISSKPASLDKRVFIYLPDKSLEKAPEKNINDVCSKMNLVSDLIDAETKEISNKKLFLSNEQKIFVNGMRYFNSKVLRSYTLRQYYPFMKDVWIKANSTNRLFNLEWLFEKNIEDITPDFIIREGSAFKDNLSQIFTAEAKQEAMEHGANVSTNVSLFIVSVCDYFNEHYNIGIEPPNYSSKRIRSGKRTNIHQWSDTVNYFKNKLDEYYGKTKEGTRKFLKLYYSLMYYIANLFPIIYEINDNNQIKGHSKLFSEFRIIEYIQNELNYLIKITNFKKSIDVDSILFNDSLDSKTSLIEFINYIFLKY